jgi:hypothetical protein
MLQISENKNVQLVYLIKRISKYILISFIESQFPCEIG